MLKSKQMLARLIACSQHYHQWNARKRQNPPPACTLSRPIRISPNQMFTPTPHRQDNAPPPNAQAPPTIPAYRKGKAGISIGCWVLRWPKMLYLRTACSDTLMLRERKASMADRSFRSLTGEFALGPCFATLVVRKLPRGQTRSGVRQHNVVRVGGNLGHLTTSAWVDGGVRLVVECHERGQRPITGDGSEVSAPPPNHTHHAWPNQRRGEGSNKEVKGKQSNLVSSAHWEPENRDDTNK